MTSALVSGGSTTAGSYTYNYTSGTNDRPLIQSVARSATGVTTTYSYKTPEQLTAASTGTASTSDSYSYDADGNLLTENLGGTTHTMAYNSADQLCWALIGTSSDACGTIPSGAVTYSYDNNGNQTISSAGEHLTYHPADQTASMTSPTGGAALAMAYAGVGNTQGTAAGSTTFTNTTLDVASFTTSGATSWFVYDPSRRLKSRLSGGARYYNPTLGAWAQLDPTSQNPGYTFVNDDPVNYDDPCRLTYTQTSARVGFIMSVCFSVSVSPSGFSVGGSFGFGVGGDVGSTYNSGNAPGFGFAGDACAEPGAIDSEYHPGSDSSTYGGGTCAGDGAYLGPRAQVHTFRMPDMPEDELKRPA